MLLLPSKSAGLVASRRSFLTGGGQAVLSATAVALIAGCAAKADTMRTQTAEVSKSDVDILNTALALEYEGIAAYQVGAESGLLQPNVLKLAVGFQSDHKQHADALAKAITKLGGMPVQSKTGAQYNFPTSTLKSQTDVLRFAAGLEEGAVNAYAGAIPLFSDKDLAGAGASILGSESMHWAILRYALGDQPPTMAFVGQSY
ncbi:MAG TPA: ferritin-like domain-containing protein [Dongiaceae bacterium]|jgi:rubrerythrin|nr:ferritin-like domain-containing protein [Dongiaceae bacterium]